MANTARDIFSAALALPEAERLELASTLIASVDRGVSEPDWEDAWIEEIDHREQVSREQGSPWSEVRGRVLERLSRR
jgi:hypothetical protein